MEIEEDINNLIEYIKVKESPLEIFVPKRNTCDIRLPFSGTWLVSSGGETEEENAHFAGDRDSKYAIDLVKVNDDGAFHSGAGESNSDYFSFGSDVYSVADGEVVAVINGVSDNQPGILNHHHSLGNCVVIKHKEFEYSLYAHLKINSITVKINHSVKLGQFIAECGNSGASTSPHLHFHMMDSNIPSLATGFLPYFSDVTVKKDGKIINLKEFIPTKSDVLIFRK